MTKEWNFHDESDTHCLPEFGGLGQGRQTTYFELCIIFVLKSMHLSEEYEYPGEELYIHRPFE